jgi:DNA-binding NarL/FixJ family response regulator
MYCSVYNYLTGTLNMGGISSIGVIIMQLCINVGILESHQSTVDGYVYRLNMVPELSISSTFLFAEELANDIDKTPMDLLITGIDVHVSSKNKNPFPILYFIDRFIKQKPDLKVLVISYINQIQLINALLEIGINGFILKDDQKSIQQLGNIVQIIANGGVFFSDGIHQDLFSKRENNGLTKRQLEVISLCAAYPDEDTFFLSKKLNISGSTFRNLLSTTYLKLGVRTRAAAIMKARQLSLIPQTTPADNYNFFANL